MSASSSSTMPRAAAFAPAATSSGFRQDVEGHEAAARAFFFDEYRLNHLEYTYAKPGVAFMDGITMGGGVGIALPLPLSRRDRAHRAGDAGNDDRHFSRRRRRPLPVAATRAARTIPCAHRCPARWRRVPAPEARHPLSSVRPARRSQGTDHRPAVPHAGRSRRAERRIHSGRQDHGQPRRRSTATSLRIGWRTFSKRSTRALRMATSGRRRKRQRSAPSLRLPARSA